jgi:hypothetical protein
MTPNYTRLTQSVNMDLWFLGLYFAVHTTSGKRLDPMLVYQASVGQVGLEVDPGYREDSRQ